MPAIWARAGWEGGAAGRVAGRAGWGWAGWRLAGRVLAGRVGRGVVRTFISPKGCLWRSKERATGPPEPTYPTYHPLYPCGRWAADFASARVRGRIELERSGTSATLCKCAATVEARRRGVKGRSASKGRKQVAPVSPPDRLRPTRIDSDRLGSKAIFNTIQWLRRRPAGAVILSPAAAGPTPKTRPAGPAPRRSARHQHSPPSPQPRALVHITEPT